MGHFYSHLLPKWFNGTLTLYGSFSDFIQCKMWKTFNHRIQTLTFRDKSRYPILCRLGFVFSGFLKVSGNSKRLANDFENFYLFVHIYTLFLLIRTGKGFECSQVFGI